MIRTLVGHGHGTKKIRYFHCKIHIKIFFINDCDLECYYYFRIFNGALGKLYVGGLVFTSN
jgi:hypothetical protein